MFQFDINTELDAVNACLSAIGELPVSSLDEFNVDVGNIRNIIARNSKRLQNNKGEGLWFNKEPNWELTAGTNGEVAIANNVLSTTFELDPRRYSNPDETYFLTKRGNKVYNTVSHSFDLTGILDENNKIYIAYMVVFLAFDDIPQTLKDAITAMSRQQFALDFETDFQRVNELKQDTAMSLLDVQAEDASQRRRNRQKSSNMLTRFVAFGSGNNPRGVC